MVGFGGALSWHTNRIYAGDNANDAALEQLMFEDLGIDVLRLKNWYYPVNYPASTDPNNVEQQTAFNNIQDFYNAAKAANPDIQVLLSSWSPPASLKSNNDRQNGGTLKQDGDGFMYDELAQYWVDCLDNLGWAPDYLSFQNEPGWVATWESCIFDPTETASNAGYAEASDTIWNAIKDRPDAPRMLGSEAENVGAFFNLNTPLLTRPYVDVHGYHTYNIGNASTIDSSSTISGLNQIRDSYSNRPNWMTEWSRDDLDWLQTARVVHNTLVEANASAYIFWKLAWEETSNDTMIAIQSDGTYEVRPHYYTIKHYAKYVDKGDRRIGITTNDNNVDVSGYLSADATRITLVAINKDSSSTAISLNHNLPTYQRLWKVTSRLRAFFSRP
jgi:glucuronoarabinoxylan endo-1,4-beta-xylanase